ncbi:hypothetical protein BDF20DRAFT_832179 [Mycotypha africana]|uniref:uncharacterized protein n=1 Tax=Mycotypha africana TaxID=64632 RepID=UPI002300B696|nr:uncharacterized protein BDF20DRAFT_832179 [Mycotypha africana]KAI8987228.1 hypothetical protein BDF20DRAFT_832179 [Mycotypha africana]
MSIFDRSRLLRWKMGWLPARPIGCNKCGAPHASRNHLLSCLSVHARLNLPISAEPNPIDYFLNTYLPKKKPKLSPVMRTTPLSSKQKHLVEYWPVLCTIMLEIDQICHPDTEFTGAALTTSEIPLLKWFVVCDSEQHRESTQED